MPNIADTGQLSEMFNQMLGTGNANMAIAYPRYRRLHELCLRQVELFEIMANTSLLKQPGYASQRAQIVKFCTDSRAKMLTLFAMDFSDYEWNLSLIDTEQVAKFTELYSGLKRDEFIHALVVMCDRLVPYRKNFEDKTAFNCKFITSMPGTEWCPFPFTTLNIKHIFSLMDVTADIVTFFMTVLSRAYEFSRKLFEELRSPDIDVDQFVAIIIESMDKIQKIPELHRCHDAFAKIKESVGMLKSNFSGYYRDFIETNDSTIIMQHFILDVGKNTNSSPRVAAQFRKIIGYYQKIAAEQTSNPKMKALFDQVNEKFKVLDANTSNLGREDKEPASDNTDKLDELIIDESDDDDLVQRAIDDAYVGTIDIGCDQATTAQHIADALTANTGRKYVVLGGRDDIHKKQSFEPKTADQV